MSNETWLRRKASNNSLPDLSRFPSILQFEIQSDLCQATITALQVQLKKPKQKSRKDSIALQQKPTKREFQNENLWSE